MVKIDEKEIKIADSCWLKKLINTLIKEVKILT